MAIKKKVIKKTVKPPEEKKVVKSTKSVTKTVKPKTSTYSEKNIKTLEGVEAVQQKKGMYVGNGATAILQLIQEVVSNSVDEAIGGHCDKIEVVMELDNSVTISDNGRGIPFKPIKHKGKMIGAAELACTGLHSGGKMDTEAYAVSAGTNGVGLTCVNALSEWTTITIHREGTIQEIKCKDGVIVQPTKQIGTTKTTGTTVSFFPSAKWMPEFGELGFDEEKIEEMLKITAYIYPTLTVTLHNKRDGSKKKSFHYDNGTVDFVNDYNNGKSILPEPLHINGSHDIKVKNKDGEENIITVKGDIALLWNDTGKESIYGFVNGLRVQEGTHITGFKLALSTEIAKAIRDRDILKGKDKNIEIIGEDTREGIVCIISINIPVPQFHSQTKDKLSNGEAQGAIQRLTGELIRETMDKSSAIAKIICNRTVSASRARRAANRARELVRKDSMSEAMSLPVKLKDCISKNPEECEIFICEGR